MANSSPLRSEIESPELGVLIDDEISLQTLDEMIEWCIEGFGWRQFLRALLVSLAWFFDGQQACISDYSDAGATCDSAGNRSVYNSIITEWGLECASSFITGLPTSCFYLGCLIGGFAFATLADSSLGRKNLLVLSCLIMSLAALATSFSPNLWVYSALRLVSGFGRASIGTSALVLSTETVEKRSRGLIGMIGLFFGTLGLLSLPAIAYLLRDASWRYLYVSTSAPAILYCLLLFFFIRESPKWLFMQGREDEAMAILRNITLPTKHGRLKSYLSSFPHKQETTKLDLYSSIKDLFRRRWALTRLAKVMALGFGIGMMYYGMLLGVGNLGFNIYLSVTFNALLIIPSYFVSYFLLNGWNRKSTILGFTMVSGALSVACAFVGSGGVEIGLELASFFCTCMAYNVLVIYTIELFPTSVRNSATSMMRQAITLGVLFDPTLISAGREIPHLTYSVFGIAIIFCGLMVLLLPETRGTTLSDTMDEQEQRDFCSE
ncbi:organic cation/carnitine transporter 3-like [Rhodamnia argentea]|uniref:Organic cation/carnitine transporter 3-like n=1 Tax=Rhodamnia argentea TaxID=178133 RepID=A0A8B8PCR2_9MYRT|nr:organic cation/carnitine transporter 3-like [Rhodamnia argentea]